VFLVHAVNRCYGRYIKILCYRNVYSRRKYIFICEYV